MRSILVFRSLALSLAFGSSTLLARHATAAEGGGAPKSRKSGGSGPEVWLCHGRALALAADDARWDFVKAHLDGIKLYIGAINKAEPAELEKFVAMLKRNDIQLSIECGGTLGHIPVNDENGRKSAQVELKAMDKIARAGGHVDFLDMDGPVSRLIKTGRHRYEDDFSEKAFKTIDPCVEQLLEYMKAVRKKYPDIGFFDLTNFPNWGYNGGVSYHARHENRQDWGDYRDVLAMEAVRAREAGMPLAGVTVDDPYDYLVGAHKSVSLRDPAEVNWLRRLRNLEDYAEGEGLAFNLIVNDEVGTMGSSSTFRENTLAYVDAYTAAGGTPERWIVQSWNKFPREVGPESDSDSMTGVVKAVIEKVKKGAN